MGRIKQNLLSAPDTLSASPASRAPNRQTPPQTNTYTKFDVIDGRHPWQQAVPETYLLYPVRKLRNCKVAHFNFTLAKEMGLIDSSHPHQLNPKLEAKILETFAIQIINEYDQLHGRKIPAEDMKPHKYMATRYLQLQHADKKGRTSGDGRSIWNGSVTHRGTTWDVSSRGTGVTSLAPGAVQANRPLKTGSTEFGYGCGMADIDELYSSAIMSEVLHNVGVGTERMLAILDVGRNLAIGVRAAPNLVRPAHLFLHLKQGAYEPLKKATDFLIERQVQNKAWSFSSKSPRKYDLMVDEICRTFAHFAGVLEREYIFMWLDWDGDNCLADAGIIDYGSIRVFGLRHDQYRYDDVDRFSTNLNEQKLKARLIVQVFVQLADYLKTGERKSLDRFTNHRVLRDFDRHYTHARRERLLHQAGYSPSQIHKLMKNHLSAVVRFENLFSYFEKVKTRKGTQELPDGINKPAIFNMRNFLREAPRELSYEAGAPKQLEDYFNMILSAGVSKKDAQFTRHHRVRLKQLIDTYLQLAELASGKQSLRRTLLSIGSAAQKTSREQRVTGNGVENVVAEILKRRKSLSYAELQSVVEAFIAHQVDQPLSPDFAKVESTPISKLNARGKLFRDLLSMVDLYREDI